MVSTVRSEELFRPAVEYMSTAVDQDAELNAAGAAVVEERVEGGADRAACIEHVIAQDHIAAFDLASDCAGSDHRAHVGGGKE